MLPPLSGLLWALQALPRTSVLVHASSGSLDESYSFADLGSKSLTGAVTAPSEDASAFADLKSKITSRVKIPAIDATLYDPKALDCRDCR